MLNHPVLVLNQNFEPIHICRVRRAILLVHQGKAEMLEDGLGIIHTVRLSIPMPSVIRLQHQVMRHRPVHRLTRIGVFHRDNFTCQYCGKIGQPLTIDHIVPRFQGGGHSWENLVAACVGCNRHKAGRTPEQAHMKLLSTPVMPTERLRMASFRNSPKDSPAWYKYLPDRKRD